MLVAVVAVVAPQLAELVDQEVLVVISTMQVSVSVALLRSALEAVVRVLLLDRTEVHLAGIVFLEH